MPTQPGEINDYHKSFSPLNIAKGHFLRDSGRRDTKVAFPEALFNQIRSEAVKRGWPFSLEWSDISVKQALKV